MTFPNSAQRPVSIARVLKDQLNFRLQPYGLSAVSSLDTANNPVLTITSGSPWATGAQYAVIQFTTGTAQANVNTDVLGLTQTIWTPDILRVNVEGNTAGSGSPEPSTSDFNSVLSFAVNLQLFGSVLAFGTRVEVWNSGHGTQPAITGTPPLPTGTLVASFDDLFNPMTSTM